MNTLSEGEEFKSLQILLGRGIRSTTVMGKLTSKFEYKEPEKTTWETQAGKFTTSKKVNVYICLTEFSATKSVM